MNHHIGYPLAIASALGVGWLIGSPTVGPISLPLMQREEYATQSQADARWELTRKWQDEQAKKTKQVEDRNEARWSLTNDMDRKHDRKEDELAEKIKAAENMISWLERRVKP